MNKRPSFRVDFHPHVGLTDAAKYFMILKAKGIVAKGDHERSLLVQTDDEGAAWMRVVMPRWEKSGLCHWRQTP